MLNSNTVRLAVIGGGVMGANHARVASRLPEIELVAIVDIDAGRRRKLAELYGATSAARLDDVVNEINAVIIATPTALHHEAAAESIEAGLHVLVEKPITTTPEEGRDLMRRAERAGVVLTVGHIERFNPAMRELLRVPNTPIHIDIQRVGPFTPRVSESVVLDLMVHDLDLARALARSEVRTIAAIAQSTKTSGPDMAVALLTFENGITASLTASRISQQKLRRVFVTLDDAVVVGDFTRQDVMIHRMQHVEYVADDIAKIRQSGMVEIPFIESRGEPLHEELRAFVAAIHGEPLVVTASDGIIAIELAAHVLDAARLGTVVSVTTPASGIR